MGTLAAAAAAAAVKQKGSRAFSESVATAAVKKAPTLLVVPSSVSHHSSAHQIADYQLKERDTKKGSKMDYSQEVKTNTKIIFDLQISFLL